MLADNALLIRPAKREDCFEIARLVLMASEGLAEFVWGSMAQPGESPIDTGARRCAADASACSYRNCFIAELANTTVGMLNAFPMEKRESSNGQLGSTMSQPFVELQDYGSLCIAGVVVDPDRRGHGIGRQLLATAEQQAVFFGLDRLSLICLEQNHGAMRFYNRLGFRETDRRRLVLNPALRMGEGDAVLLTKRTDTDQSGRAL